MDLAARSRRHLLLGFLLTLFSDPRADRAKRHSPGERLSGRRAQSCRREGILVRSVAAVDQRERSRARRARLDRLHRIGRPDFQPLAAREHRRRRNLFSVVHRCGSGFCGVSIRRHASRGGAAVDLFCAARSAAGARRGSASVARQPLHAPMGVVSHLLRIGRGEDSQRRDAVAESDGDGQVLRKRPAAELDRMACAAVAAFVSRSHRRVHAHRRAARCVAGVLSEVVAPNLLHHHHAAPDRNHPHRELRVSELSGSVPRIPARG